MMEILLAFWQKIAGWARLLAESAWALIGTAHEWLALAVGPFRAAVLVAGVVLVSYVASHGLQRRLIREVDERAGGPRRPAAAPIPRIEWRYSLLFPLEWLFSLYRLVVWLAGLPRRFLRRRSQKGGADVEGGSKKPGGSSPAPQLQVPTLGPTFVYAAAIVAGLYWSTRVLEPLARAQLRLADGQSVYQFLFFGHSPFTHFVMPMEDRPYPAVLLSVLFLFACWWTLGNLLRLLRYRKALELSLAGKPWLVKRLASWTDWAGVSRNLEKPSKSFRLWSGWTLALTSLGLLWAASYLDGAVYRVRPSAFGCALMLWTSWFVHLRLEGVARLDGPRRERGEAAAAGQPGWREVEEHLISEGRMARGPQVSRSRPLISPVAESAERVSPEDGLLSPLALEILKGLGSRAGEDRDAGARRAGLTAMQSDVLRRLSLASFVDVDPPPAREGELELASRASAGLRNASGQRQRDQIVLAPEGAGKSTL
ncbi:MAG: hypothetical protein AAF725_26985, partial [Acidobacteriota bacterium]